MIKYLVGLVASFAVLAGVNTADTAHIHSVEKSGHLVAVEQELRNGMDVNLTDQYRETPPIQARENGHTNIVDSPQNKKEIAPKKKKKKLIMNIDLNKEVEVKFSKCTCGWKASAITFENDITKANSLKMVFHDKGVSSPIHLDKQLRERILHFIQMGPIKEPFDCNSFVHFINGLGYAYGNLLYHRWDLSTLHSEPELNPGDSILMTRTHDIRYWTHLAMYLGKGRYISKFGEHPVYITTMKELQGVYGHGPLFKMTLKA